MIDEKKLIEVIKNVQDHMKEKNKEPVPVDAREIFTLFIEMVESQSKLNEWIPCSERLPEFGEKVLCSLNPDNPTIIHLVVISTCDGSCYWHDGTILAWQPLPEPYREKVEE